MITQNNEIADNVDDVYNVNRDNEHECATVDSDVYKNMTEQNSKTWNTLIEKVLPATELATIHMLTEYVLHLINEPKTTDPLSSFVNGSSVKYKILDDDIYLTYIRGEINAALHLFTDVHKKTHSKESKINKKDIIILKNLTQSIKIFINTALKTTVGTSNVISATVLSCNILEYVGIVFMLQLKRYIRIMDTSFDLEVYKLALSTYISTLLYIKNCKNIIGSSYVSPTKTAKLSSLLINDMNDTVTKFKAKMYIYDNTDIICGSINDIYKYAPNLLTRCDHINIIPGVCNKPRKSQSDTLIKFINNFNDGVIIITKATIGSGKTTLIVPLAKYIQEIRKQPKYKSMQLIYCCDILSIQIQVAALCFNTVIPFGIASIENEYYDSGRNIVDKWKSVYTEEVVKITNNNNCKNNNRIVIIGCPKSVELLNKSNREYYRNNYAIFFDEPTYGFDSVKTKKSLLLSQLYVLMNLPKRSIISSATMPELDTPVMKSIISDLKNRYTKIFVDVIIGNEIFIGCNVTTDGGDIIVPHNDCDIKLAVDRVKHNPFMGRMYTYDVLKTLSDITKKKHCMDVFDNIEYINANAIKDQSLLLLESMIGEPAIRCSKNTNIDAIIDKNKLGTSDAYKCPNMTLITLEINILPTVSLMFGDLIKMSPVYITIMKKYDLELLKYTEYLDKRVKLQNMADNKKSIHDSSKEKCSKNDIEKELENITENKPRLNFPKHCIINSVEHLKKFNNTGKIKPRIPFVLETLSYDFNVIDDVKILLMCGVGIYIPTLFDVRYTNTIMTLASNGALAYVISNSEICYGTNYPFNTVIITEDFAKTHSINTLFQLMGRAGRCGKSWTANAIVPDYLYDVFVEYIKNPHKYDIEEKNMYRLLMEIK